MDDQPVLSYEKPWQIIIAALQFAVTILIFLYFAYKITSQSTNHSTAELLEMTLPLLVFPLLGSLYFLYARNTRLEIRGDKVEAWNMFGRSKGTANISDEVKLVLRSGNLGTNYLLKFGNGMTFTVSVGLGNGREILKRLGVETA